ncbi:uncharacterized protein LOC120334303 [Styela clava]
MKYFRVALISIWLIIGAKSEYSKCFSNVVCRGGGLSYEMKSLQIYPFPDCCGDSTNGQTTMLYDLNRTLSERIQTFQQELSGTTVTRQSTQGETCYAPVTCNSQGANWMQVYPPVSCYLNKNIGFELNDDIIQTMEDAIDGAIRAMDDSVNASCGPCALTSSEYLDEKNRLRSTKVIQGIESQQPCAVPATCLGKESVVTTWLTILPLPEKEGASTMKVNEMTGGNVVDAMNESLERSIKMIENFNAGNCGGCTTAPTTT